MDWFYPKRRGPIWKPSPPSLHLVMIFGIVISLLWLSKSQHTDYKAQPLHTVINFQLFLLLSPILLIFFMMSHSTCGRLNFRLNSHGFRP